MIQNYESFATWGPIIYFVILGILLLFGNIIRRKIPIFRKSLLPTAVIAGLVGLLIKEIVVRPMAASGFLVTESGIIAFNNFLNLITYHTLALGFIAMGLKVNEKLEIKTNRAHSYYNGLVIVSTYLLQGIIGIGITFILAYTFMPVFQTGPGLATGLLLPFGFGQGPGQANNFGVIYETFDPNGFAGGQSYGLAMASMGFIWASIGGVFYLNKFKKLKVSGEEKKSTLTSLQEIEAPDEIPVAESMDKLTVQIALILAVYGLTLLTMFGLSQLVSLNPTAYKMLNSLIWGFNFIFGMMIALLSKKFFVFLRKTGLMTRQYPNNFMLNRIAGVVFDVMVVSSILAINFEDLSKNNIWIAFLLISSVGGAATMFYMHHLTKRVYKEYPLEGFSGMYGMLTGTASTGIALLREVDPYYKTPAATDLVTGTTTAILFGLPILLIASFAPQGITQALISLGILVILYVAFATFLFKKHPKVK
jgi:ESS family glutamate:Na+ symporter